MATKSVGEQISTLNEKIAKLEEQKKVIESKLAEAKQKKSVLEAKVDLGYLESIKALGLSMDDLMKLAKEKATSMEENSKEENSNAVSESEDVEPLKYNANINGVAENRY